MQSPRLQAPSAPRGVLEEEEEKEKEADLEGMGQGKTLFPLPLSLSLFLFLFLFLLVFHSLRRCVRPLPLSPAPFSVPRVASFHLFRSVFAALFLLPVSSFRSFQSVSVPRVPHPASFFPRVPSASVPLFARFLSAPVLPFPRFLCAAFRLHRARRLQTTFSLAIFWVHTPGHRARRLYRCLNLTVVPNAHVAQTMARCCPHRN